MTQRPIMDAGPGINFFLSDDATPALVTAVRRISGEPFETRVLAGKDLGETMVIAHAVTAAETGADVMILIDEGDGVRAASREARRLERLKANGSAVGTIGLVNSLGVLEAAAGGEYLPDRQAMRDLYERMRGLDDGLPPLTSTDLMNLPCWGR